MHTAGGPEVLRSRSGRSRSDARDGSDPRKSGRAQSLRDVYAPRALARRHVPSYPRHRGNGSGEDAPGGEFERATRDRRDGGLAVRSTAATPSTRWCRPRMCDGSSTDLPWETLGALPEMLQTVWGSLFTALRLQSGDRLLIRGGTTSIGLAAVALSVTGPRFFLRRVIRGQGAF